MLLLHQYGVLLPSPNVHAPQSSESCGTWFRLEELHLLPRNVWVMLLLDTWKDGRKDLPYPVHVS